MSVQAFYIVCKEGVDNKITVSEKEAEVLMRKSDYFRAMFEHGTSAAETRTIHKAAWTAAAANSVIHLICFTETKAKTLDDARALLLASNEILLDVEIFGLESSIFLESNYEDKFSFPQRWTLVTNSRQQIWLGDIFLFPIAGLKIVSVSPRISAGSVFSSIFMNFPSTADFAVHSRNDDITSAVSELAQKLKSRTC